MNAVCGFVYNFKVFNFQISHWSDFNRKFSICWNQAGHWFQRVEIRSVANISHGNRKSKSALTAMLFPGAGTDCQQQQDSWNTFRTNDGLFQNAARRGQTKFENDKLRFLKVFVSVRNTFIFGGKTFRELHDRQKGKTENLQKNSLFDQRGSFTQYIAWLSEEICG